MKYFRVVKTKAIYDGKYHVFCHITNNYFILILNLIHLDFILINLTKLKIQNGWLLTNVGKTLAARIQDMLSANDSSISVVLLVILVLIIQTNGTNKTSDELTNLVTQN